MHHHIGDWADRMQNKLAYQVTPEKCLKQMHWHVRGGLQSQTTVSATLE